MSEDAKLGAKRILVVDDDVKVLSSIEKQLRKESFALELVHDPMEALRRIEREKYHLVISDVMMKPISGLDVLRRIKAERPLLPVIILTGYVDDRTIDEARRIGSADFLLKPVRKRRLIGSIYSALGISSPEGEAQ